MQIFYTKIIRRRNVVDVQAILHNICIDANELEPPEKPEDEDREFGRCHCQCTHGRFAIGCMKNGSVNLNCLSDRVLL